MEFFRKATMLLFVVIIATLGPTMAAVYQVGESAGWDFHYNYDEWASSKNFQVGDTLVFNYNPQFHNVRQVKIKAYNKCSDKKPIASYNSGSDSLTLQTPGDYYFICGISGDCAAGLKLHVKVSSSSTSPTNPTIPVTPPTPFPVQTPPAAPTPPSSNIPTPDTKTSPERGFTYVLEEVWSKANDKKLKIKSKRKKLGNFSFQRILGRIRWVISGSKSIQLGHFRSLAWNQSFGRGFQRVF